MINVPAHGPDLPPDVSPEPCFQPRVLVVDDEPEVRSLYSTLLQHWNYIPIAAQGRGAELLANAIDLSRQQRCHLALVDLRLIDSSDPGDSSGLELLPNLKPAETIIVTGFPSYQLVRMGLTDKGAVSIIGKQEGPERLKEELDRAARKFCASRSGLVIHPPTISQTIGHDLFPDDPDIPPDEVADLLARLFPDAPRIEVKTLEGVRRRDQGRAPRQRSHVLLVRKGNLQPELVKVARARKIEKEVKRYQDHIEGRLVGNFSPPVRRWAALWDIGAALYPFLGVTSIQPFSRYFANRPVPDILHSLHHFFDQTWSELYATRLRKRKDVFDAYSEVWDPGWYAKRVLASPPLDPADAMPPAWRWVQAPDPVAWLKARLAQRESPGGALPTTALAVTHGDLHGDNMLVDEHRAIWVIDFERSGYGPALQDFVELEADIIYRLVSLPEDDFSNFYRLCAWAVQPEHLEALPEPPPGLPQPLDKAMQVIHALRQMAHLHTTESDARPYLWGMLFNCLFRASLLWSPKYRRSQQRALMLGSMICHRLDHWDASWPPADWPPLLPPAILH